MSSTMVGGVMSETRVGRGGETVALPAPDMRFPANGWEYIQFTCPRGLGTPFPKYQQTQLTINQSSPFCTETAADTYLQSWPKLHHIHPSIHQDQGTYIPKDHNCPDRPNRDHILSLVQDHPTPCLSPASHHCSARGSSQHLHVLAMSSQWRMPQQHNSPQRPVSFLGLDASQNGTSRYFVPVCQH